VTQVPRLAHEVPFDALTISVEMKPVKGASHAAVYDAPPHAAMSSEMRALGVQHRDFSVAIPKCNELVSPEGERPDLSGADVRRAQRGEPVVHVLRRRSHVAREHTAGSGHIATLPCVSPP